MNVVLALTLLAGLGGTDPPRPYTLQILPSHLPTAPAFPAALSDRGEVVGEGIEQFWFQAAYWPDAGSVVDLAATEGFESSFGGAIDSAGRIVGSAAFDATAEKESAFLLEPGGSPQFLPELSPHPAIGSHAAAVTDTGLIAGWCDTVPEVFFDQPHAVLWENGAILDLGTLPGGLTSRAVALNESKLVVGVAELPFDHPPPLIRAFAWTEQSGLVQLPGLHPLGRSLATDVDEQGLVVGEADDAQGRFPVVWPALDAVEVLPLLPGDLYGGCAGVDDFGRIVGYGRVTEGFAPRLWQGDRVYDLAALSDAGPLTLGHANAINARGQVLVEVWDFTVEPAVPLVGLLTPDGLWEDLGAGLAGTLGVPRLAGYANFLPGGPVVVEVEDALPGALGFAVFGASQIDLPLLGGTLVPDPTPPGFVAPFLVDGGGFGARSFQWPNGLPSGLELFAQAWILDPGAVQGAAASNALRADVP